MTNPLFTRTELTRAFSGRPARGLVNRFMREHGRYAPPAYPEVHHLTTGLRKAAPRSATRRAWPCGPARDTGWPAICPPGSSSRSSPKNSRPPAPR